MPDPQSRKTRDGLFMPVGFMVAIALSLALAVAAFHELWWAIAVLSILLAGILGLLYATVRRSNAQANALHVLEERFRLMAEGVVDYAIFMLDEKGHVASWGAGAQRFKGYLAGEIIGRHFSVFYPPEDIAADKPRRELEEAAAAGRMEDRGWRVRKDGSRFWAHVVITAIRDASGKLQGFGKVTRDLTEAKRAEDTLKAANETLERRVAQSTAELSETRVRLSGIIDSAMDAIITVDQDQRIVLFNAAAEALFRCPQAEALGAPLTWFIPKRFRAGHAAHVAKFGEAGTASRKMGAQRIVMGQRRDREEFPIEAAISQVEQVGRKFYTVILRDVTERVLAEEKLRESQEELHEIASGAQAAREQEKGRIAREMHDELGQLLTSLKMDLARLKTAPALAAHEADLAGMTDVLDRMVAATRRIAADLRPQMLDDLGLVPAAEWLVSDFRKRSGIECSLVVEPPEFDVQDPHATAIYRILQESLTNIAKHAKAAFVDVGLRLQDDVIELTIHDNGRGFRTTDPRKPASFGLIGLRERAYFLGGSVSIESTAGRGTTIVARIPLHPVPGAALAR